MKVIFLQDVHNVARVGDIKEVADGYGRNFLIPKKLAAPVNTQATASVEAQVRMKARLQAEAEANLVELASQLDGKEVNIKTRTGAKERLYGSITTADIAIELKSATGLLVDKRKIELDEPIRQLGSYDIDIRLAKDIAARIKVNITKEEEAE